MYDKRTKALILAGSVFSISTTLGQVVSIESWLVKLLVGIPNLLIWFYVLYCYVTFKAPKPTRVHIKKLHSMMKQDRELRFRTIPDKETLKRLWKLDQQAYGEYSIDFETFIEWWKQYPSGILIMTRGSKILGSIGIWPLTEECFEEIKELRKNEKNIRAHDIVTQAEAFKCKTWYISGIMLNTPEQSFHLLIAHALHDWSKITSNKGIFKFLALAYTREDQDLLELLEFQEHCSNSPKGFLPTYYRSIEDKADIDELIKSLRNC